MLLSIVAAALIASPFVVASPALAKQNNKNSLSDDIKRADKQINAARDKVNAAKKQMSDAKSNFSKLSSALEKAIDHAGDVRRKVESEHDSASPLVNARRTLDDAKAAFEEKRDPLLKKLGESSSYQEAVAAREAAKSKLATAGADEKEAAGKAYANAMSTVRKMETAAVNADPTAKAAWEKSTSAESAVQDLIVKRNEAVNRDSRIAESRRALDKAKEEAAKAKQHFEQEVRQLADAEKKLKHEEQQKHNLQQRQKQNNQKKNGKKK